MTFPRLDEPELLDEHDAPEADVERSLRDLRRINRYLGGIVTYRRMVRGFQPVRSIADLGAGTADLLDSVPGRLTRVALDFKIEHLLHERNGSRAHRVVGDARRLPFRDDAIDLVTSSHFFHHFTPDENAAILAESLRIARKGVAVTDTQRNYVPLLFVQLLALLRLVGRITRYDAPASVRRGYTHQEAREIAMRVSTAKTQVKRYFPFRFGILLWKRPQT